MSRPWMPLYVADYLADTAHLSAAEHGAYLLLIMHYWQKSGLPADERQLARIARLTKDEWTESRDTLSAFFGDGWKHARIDAELAEAREKYEKRAAAGRRGGKAKAMPEQCSSNAQAGLNQPQPHKIPDASASGAVAPIDARSELFSEGAAIVQKWTGKSDQAARSFIGKLLKEARDDCVSVLDKIRTADRDRMAEPIAWVVAAVSPRNNSPPKKTTLASMWNDEAINHGILDDPSDTDIRRLGAGLARGQNQGHGFARRIAGPRDLEHHD